MAQSQASGVRANRGVIAASRPSPRRRRPSARLRAAARVGGQCRSAPDQFAPLAKIRAHVEQQRPAAVEDQLPVAGAHRPLRRARRSRARTASARSPARALRAPAAGRSLRGAPRPAPAFRVAARMDAVRSIVIPTWRETRPAGMCPGQRRIAGTRMPPSQTVPLWWKSGVVARQPFAAVVVGEDHDRVLPQAKIVEGARGSGRRPDRRARASRRSRRACSSNRRTGRGAGRCRAPWTADRARWYGQCAALYATSMKNGRLRVLLDEPHRPLGDQVRHVAGGPPPAGRSRTGRAQSLRPEVCW